MRGFVVVFGLLLCAAATAEAGRTVPNTRLARKGRALTGAAQLRNARVHGNRAVGGGLIAEALASRSTKSRIGVAQRANQLMRRGPEYDQPGAVGNAAIARALVSRGRTERRAAYRVAERIATARNAGLANVANALVAMAYSTTSAGNRVEVRRRADSILAMRPVDSQPGALGAAAIARARVSRGGERRISFKRAMGLVESGHVMGAENVGNALVAMAISAETSGERAQTRRHIAFVTSRPQVYDPVAVGSARIAQVILARREFGRGSAEAAEIADAVEPVLHRPTTHGGLSAANAAIAIVIASE